MASRKLQTEEEVGSGSALSKWNRKKANGSLITDPRNEIEATTKL